MINIRHAFARKRDHYIYNYYLAARKIAQIYHYYVYPHYCQLQIPYQQMQFDIMDPT